MEYLHSIEAQQSNLLATIKENLMPNGKNLSIFGLSRLCGVRDTSIIRASAFKPQKLGQTLTEKGFQASALIRNGFNAVATWLTIEYFAYDSKAKALGAKQIARTFGALGVYQTFENLSQPEEKKKIEPSLAEYTDIAIKLENLVNPMIKSILEQRLMEEVSSKSALREPQRTCILTVRAKELGFSDKQIGTGSALGKYISSRIKPLGKQQHGRYQVNTYRLTEKLDKTIRAFFYSFDPTYKMN